MTDTYGVFSRKPLESIVTYPKVFGIGTTELRQVKRMAKCSQIVGYTFLRDELTIICTTTYDLGFDGISYTADCQKTKFLYTHWIVLKEKLLESPAKFRSILNHEMCHTLAATFGMKQKWGMQDWKEIAKEACCSDLDRWSWHMMRAYEQFVWR